MTYRFIPQKWLLAAQLSTLATTAVVGMSVYLTPPQKDVKLTVLEQEMNPKIWAIALIVAGTVGLISEIIVVVTKQQQRLLSLVAYSHIVCAGGLAGLSASVLVSVIERQPWNFGAPILGLLMVFWHALFSKRRRPPNNGISGI